MLGRRQRVISGSIGIAGLPRGPRAAASTQRELIEEARSPQFIWNAVALTKAGRIFVGMPRWPGFNDTPSVAEVMPDGSLTTYPGGEWNTWAPGQRMNTTD